MRRDQKQSVCDFKPVTFIPVSGGKSREHQLHSRHDRVQQSGVWSGGAVIRLGAACLVTCKVNSLTWPSDLAATMLTGRDVTASLRFFF